MRFNAICVAVAEAFVRLTLRIAGPPAFLLWVIALSGCATPQHFGPHFAPTPTEKKPVLACAITCPTSTRMLDPETGESDHGFQFRRQHLCRSGRRWFRDVWIVGEILDRWLLCEGHPAPPDYKCKSGFELPKVDVEVGSCSTVIASIIRARAVELRGRHPGEDEQGRSLTPP